MIIIVYDCLHDVVIYMYIFVFFYIIYLYHTPISFFHVYLYLLIGLQTMEMRGTRKRGGIHCVIVLQKILFHIAYSYIYVLIHTHSPAIPSSIKTRTQALLVHTYTHIAFSPSSLSYQSSTFHCSR